jgi:ribonucleotide reductase beta subunit family protein with ferritin-like domain
MTHSEMGCMLFRDLVKEIGITEEEKKLVYDGFETGLEKEFSFIDNLFSNRSLDTITKDELKDYMYVRANNRLEALGLKPKYTVSGISDNLREWFSLETQGQSSNDFFWQSLDGGNYSALLSQNFEDFDYSKINLEWND